MEYLDNKIIAGVISFILIGLFGWFKIKGFSIYDRHIIYKWLKLHTRDEPGESHVEAITIAIVILMAGSSGVFGASNRKAVMKAYPKKRYLKEWHFEK